MIYLKNINIDTSFIKDLKLKPYPFQILGVNFLCDVKKGMIADDMGLGKTIQIALAVYKLYKEKKINNALIICPSALKYQWLDELNKFIDLDKENIKAVLIDGTPKKREKLYKEINENKPLFVITNYELVKNDLDFYKDIKWDIIALDEAQKIRSSKSQTSQKLRQLKAEYKWCATGTPVQNRPEEIFSIFAFIDKNIFGSWKSFRSRYINIGYKFGNHNVILGYKNLHQLHSILSNYVLRRLKKDVAEQLPEMIIVNRYVELSKEQLSIHKQVYDKWLETVKLVNEKVERNEDGEIVKSIPQADRVLGYQIIMQEICDDLRLLEMSNSKMSQYYAIKGYNQISSKIIELDNIIEEYLSQENCSRKIVIFTQFARMQGILYNYLQKYGQCTVINGSMNALQKQKSVVDFKLNDEIMFFLATDAGNYGINLENSDLLINFDINWDPAIWLQRNSRIHRLSSTFDKVTIINLIAKDGIDEKILNTLYNKQDMSNQIIENTPNETRYINALHKLISNRKEK